MKDTMVCAMIVAVLREKNTGKRAQTPFSYGTIEDENDKATL